MTYDGKLRVWRGDASGGGLQDFTVPVQEGEVVLDIIHRLQATQTGGCGRCIGFGTTLRGGIVT